MTWVSWLGLRVGGHMVLNLHLSYEPIDDSTLSAPL